MTLTFLNVFSWPGAKPLERKGTASLADLFYLFIFLLARREAVGAQGHGELSQIFHSIVPVHHCSLLLKNDPGLFTGEMLMHIEVQSQPKLNPQPELYRNCSQARR